MNDLEPLLNGEEKQNDDMVGELMNLVLAMLVQPCLSEQLDISPELQQYGQFQKLYTYLYDLRKLSAALSKGDLQEMVFSKGFVLSNLKALQSNLRHLTWQTKEVAEGDFSQRVDFLGEFSDSFNEMIIKLQNSSAQLMRLASVDVLTQIPNRLVLEEFLISSFADAKQHETDFSILIIDIDFFKAVNDTYGHAVGDMVLVKVSETLNRQFRSSDIFARYGGEEFVAGLPGTNLEAAERIAQRAQRAVHQTIVRLDDDTELFVTVSIGVSNIQETDESYQDIINRSDRALYRAKNTGRNRVCVE